MRNSQENHPQSHPQWLTGPAGSPMTLPDAVPLVLVSGFLGAGKTTLMRRLILEAAQRGLRPAVIVNEFGAADVDGHILRQADAELIAAISGGCACCSGQDDLRETLLELTVRDATARPGVVLIEASGLADPLLLLDAVTGAELLPLVRVASLISVADAARHLDFGAELGPLLRRQVLLSDVIVLNKTDRADEITGETASQVAAALRKINPRACIMPATWAQCDLAPVWDAVAAPGARVEGVVPKNRDENAVAPTHSHYHAVVCPMPHPVEKTRLEAALGRLGPQVWRAKGFVRVRGLSGWQLLQYTGGGQGNPYWHLAPFHVPAYAEEPDAVLVFLGAALDRVQLLRDFSGTKLLAMM